MNTRRIMSVEMLLLAGVLLCGAILSFAGDNAKRGGEGQTTISNDTSAFQGVTNVVFRFLIGVEKDKSGQEITKWKKFNVSDPEQIKKLVSAIKLEPGPQFSDEHMYDVTFQKPSGEIFVGFCPRCFQIVDSQQPYRYRHFAMPKEFYAEFRKLARRHGWKAESK
jgi:hypothetical protein